MKLILAITALTFLATPLPAQADSGRLYEKWEFRTEEDINAWNYAGLDEGGLSADGLKFDVDEKAVLYRSLPEGFHSEVDAMRVRYDAQDLEEVSLLFITLNDDGSIGRHYRIGHIVEDEGTVSKYVPLALHRWNIRGMEMLAVSFKGESKDVSLDSVRFLHYTFPEKMMGLWRSFWTMETFEPFTVNIMHGPTVVTDIGPYREENAHWQILARSLNAYLLVGLSIFGVCLLFWGAHMRTHRGWSWQTTRKRMIFLFTGVIASVWVLYDMRMGAEFIRNVARDHIQYISAEKPDRTFRDLGNFYDFVNFAKPLLSDYAQYELFLDTKWPYESILRYETYPSRPNQKEEIVSDVWVIYDRSDVTIGEDGSLILNQEPFTAPGELIGRFDEKSFIYRAIHL